MPNAADVLINRMFLDCEILINHKDLIEPMLLGLDINSMPAEYIMAYVIDRLRKIDQPRFEVFGGKNAV